MTDTDDGITTSIWMKKTDRQQLRKLADKVDRITQADRRFFERFPHRQHLIRLASRVEIEQQTLLDDGKPPWIPQGYDLFAVVRNVVPGVRLRLFAPGPTGVDTDVPEKIVRGVWEAVATPEIWKIEAQMRRLSEIDQ